MGASIDNVCLITVACVVSLPDAIHAAAEAKAAALDREIELAESVGANVFDSNAVDAALLDRPPSPSGAISGEEEDGNDDPSSFTSTNLFDQLDHDPPSSLHGDEPNPFLDDENVTNPSSQHPPRHDRIFADEFVDPPEMPNNNIEYQDDEYAPIAEEEETQHNNLV